MAIKTKNAQTIRISDIVKNNRYGNIRRYKKYETSTRAQVDFERVIENRKENIKERTEVNTKTITENG